MAYVLRFIQSYKPAHRQEFLALESKFEDLERNSKTLPKGRRSQPLAGSEPTNTLIWELTSFDNDPEHTRLFEQQAPYILQVRTEILERLNFSA
jgi:hypothetical protein